MPEPDEVRSAGGRQVLVFLVDDPAEPLEVSIGYIPKGLGPVSARAGVVDGPELEKSCIAEADILHAARATQGLERMDR